MNKRIVTILMGVLCAATMRGQSSSDTPSLPQLATPSPKATMIDRFGYYPTNLYTGLVDITIPIHTIEVKGIRIPIEFKYHASGLKYDDLPMEVGYGWTLMAGGSVSYSARGTGISKPVGTELSPFIKQASDVILNDKTGKSDSDQLQLEYVENGIKNSYANANYFRDSEYDVYNYTFPGHSGQHYVMSNGDDFTIPATLDLSEGFTPVARDEQGNVYYFEYGDGDEYRRSYTYYLTRIVSADGKETINFQYKYFGETEANDVRRPILNYSFIIREISRYGGTTTSDLAYGGGMPGLSYKNFRTPVLTEISSSAGKVKFHYSSQPSHSLVKITITSATDVILKNVNLNKTNDAYLNSVNYCTPTGTSIYSYLFEYNGTKPEGNVGIDYWGYYNSSTASTANKLYVPDFTVPRYGYSSGQKIPGMNRTPNATTMQLSILKKITYPTRGYSEFTYEPHRSNGQMFGGLRIAEIKSYDENKNLLESKWYKYGFNEDGNGRAIRAINSNDYLTASLVVENRYDQSGNSINDPGDKTTYKEYFPFPKCSYFNQGSTVVYPYVTEYVGSSSGNYGKTEYAYTDFPDYINNWSRRGYTTEFPLWSYAWKSGKLLRKTVKNSGGKMVYSLENVYEETNRKDHMNLRVSRFARITDRMGTYTEVEKLFSAPGKTNFGNAIGGSLHDYYNYYITSGEYAVKESRETKDGATRIACYKYNGIGQMAEEAIAVLSGDTLATRYRYPYDLWKEGTGSQLQDKMFQKHIIDPVLKKSVYKDRVLINQIANEYKDWGGFIALQYVKQPVGGVTFQPRITYHSYDCYGNPASMANDDLERVEYLWGYKGQRPIAEIKNGSFSALGQAFIDRVTKANSPTSADMSAIEALRTNTAFANSLITTFYYDSDLQPLRITAPNGAKSSLEYDAFGRLMCVKDQNGKIVEAYQYDYKQ